MKWLRSGLIVALMLIGAARVEAHAFLDHAEPRVGAVVEASPARVTLWMTMDVQPAASTVAVYDANKHEVDNKDMASKGATMTVSLPKLPPGKYRVEWKALCPYGHHTAGSFAFTVK